MSVQAAINGLSHDYSPVKDDEIVATHEGSIHVEDPPAPRELAVVKQSTVSLVIPARNEARNLHHVLDHLPEGLNEVILVDGHSSDITRSVARTCCPEIRIITQSERGKGQALRAGFEAATSDIIVAMDADGSMSPEEIPHYVYFIERGFDFVKGSRFVGGGGSLDITPLRRLGNRGLLALANQLYGAHLTDLCYGFFAFRRKYLAHLDLRSSGFEIETELTVRACMTGLRIAEIPSMELPRRSGQSNLRSFRDGQRVLKTLFKERHRTAPISNGEQRLLEIESDNREWKEQNPVSLATRTVQNGRHRK